jgi:hypothetical protein
MRCLALGLALCVSLSALGTTIESPAKGKSFKRGERIVCAGQSDEAGGAVVVNVKQFNTKIKKIVTYGSKAATLESGPWTLEVEPPTTGWPLGEMTIEIHSARRGRIESAVKIVIE